MALNDRINTAKEVLADTRSRVVVIIMTAIVVVVIGIAYLKFKHSGPAAGMGSEMTGAPNIVSIPGMGQPSREYAKLQEQQNSDLAAEAARKGTSAMPTVVRSTYIDSGVSNDLSKQSGATSVTGCAVGDLKAARDSGVTTSELRCRGCSLAALLAAGYSVAELRAAGFSAKELKDAGASAADLLAAGFSASELAAAGFNSKELIALGSSACTFQTINPGANKSSTKNCDIKKLQAARGKGTPASLDCVASNLLLAGYTAAELKGAGFGAKELKDAGMDATKLRNAGFTATELRAACFDVKELKDAGFSVSELKSAGFSAGELRNGGFSADELKAAGFSAIELKAAGFSAAELSAAKFTADELKAAGYTNGELTRAGVIAGLGGSVVVEVNSCSAESLNKARVKGTSVAELKNRGCSVASLKAAGFTADELKAAGFSADELKVAGFSDEDLKQAGFAPATVKSEYDSTNSTSLQDQLGKISDAKIANMTDQEIDNFKKQQQALMQQQADQLFKAWNQLPTQAFVQGEAPKTEQATTEEKAASNNKDKEKKAAIDLKNSDIYKAGAVIFAVLDTGVNSDENSPVMATVVQQGPLKGSKLIGNFQRVSEKAMIQFSVISVPKLSQSITVNAVAVDPSTAKTSLATDVNNHYMLRYGTLFASSFINGIGQAFQTAGGSSTTSATTGTVSTMPSLNLGQKLMVGLGNVGQQFGTAMAPYMTLPPTVKIKAGISIGVLLMADLVVPKAVVVQQ